MRIPREEATVDHAVREANRRASGYLLKETWTTLAEFNEVVEERACEIDHEISRADG
ncbi:MAG: hypothetical protein ACP5P1_10565 [Acidimicrobiales bacterium]